MCIMKVVTLVPVKNESWILDFTLKNFELFSDAIIVLDDNSTDNSREICSRYNKVRVIAADSTPGVVNMSKRRQSLLDEGRKAGGTHFIFLDADESLSATGIATIRTKIEKMNPGDTLHLQWALIFAEKNGNLFYNKNETYAKDFIFCDNKKNNFGNAALSEERTPVSSGAVLQIPLEEGYVLHFQQLAYVRNQYKQIWYRCNEYIEGKRSAKRINATYEFTKNLELKNPFPIEDSFTKENLSFIKPHLGETEPLLRVRTLFDTYGVKYFESLDIWYLDATYTIFKEETGKSPHPQLFPKWILRLNTHKNKIKNYFPASGVKLYSTNIGWSLFAKVSSLIISLATLAGITRILGPESFGVLTYVLGFGAIFSVLVNLGIDNVVYKNLNEEKNKIGEILGTSLLLKICAGIVGILIVALVNTFSTEQSDIKSLILLFSLGYITQPFSLLFLGLLAERKSKIIAYIQITTILLASILKIVFLYLYGSLSLFIIVQSLEALFSGILVYIFLTKTYGKDLRFSFSKQRALSFFRFVVPLTLFSLFSEIYYKIDVLMLRHLDNATTVGLYSAAVKLTEVWYFISYISAAILFPALVTAFASQDKKEYLKRLSALGYAFIFISIIAILGTWIFGKLAISLIYGPLFVGSVPLLYIYILSLPGSLILSIMYQDLLLRNKLWSITALAFVPAVVNVILNLILIPRHAGAGAALATVISYNCITLYFLYYMLTKNKKRYAKNTI